MIISRRDVLLLMLAALGLVWYASLWVVSLVGWRAARRRYRLRPRSPSASSPPDSVPGVSILRPLKGLDANLYENLESTFTQEYPKYEILMCVADAQDPALRVARDLIAKYPRVNARVVVGEEVVGVNPKVNNLMPAYRQAAHDILWVIDSNVTVSPGTLGRAVDTLNTPPTARQPKRVGLVNHVPFAMTSTRTTLGTWVEVAFLNTNHARMYVALNTIAIDSCVMGKSNMFRRSDLDKTVGGLKRPPPADCTLPRGLAAFGKYLAEDNMIGEALWHELDTRHDLSCDVAYNTIGTMSFADYCWRRIRWIRVRKKMVVAATLVEPFTESLILGVIAATALNSLLGIPVWITGPLHLIAWLSVDLDVYSSLAGHPVWEGDWTHFLFAWAIREAAALPIWFVAMCGNTVMWRGRQYEILANGGVRLVEAKSGGGLFSWIFGRRDHYQPLSSDG